MNKNTYLIICTIFLLCINAISGQECPEYNRLITEGDNAFKSENYEMAINRYNVAILHCQSKSEETQEKIGRVFKKIQDIKNTAIKNEQKAATAEQVARKAQLEAEEQRRITLSEKEKVVASEKKAKEAQASAEEQERIALSEKEKAEKALIEVEKQKQKAENGIM